MMLMNDGFERFGRSSEFAIDVRLIQDPDEDNQAPMDAVGSWGQWRLWVDGLNLCEHNLTPAEGQVQRRDEVTWYLAALFLWFAESWGPMLHEQRFPSSGKPSRAENGREAYLSLLETWGDDSKVFGPWQDWAKRHSLRWASEGGLLPDVFIRRLGDDVEISWGDRWQPGSDAVQFQLETGVAHSPVKQFADALNEAFQWFLDQKSLRRQPWFSHLKRSVDLRSAPEASESFLPWYLDSQEREGALTRLFQRTRARLAAKSSMLFNNVLDRNYLAQLSPAAAMFGALSPEISEQAAAQLLAVTIESLEPRNVSSPVDDFVIDAPAWRTSSAWDDGYRLALDFLDESDAFPSGTALDLPLLLQQLQVQTVTEHLDSIGPRGVALAGEGLSPTIVVNADHPMNKAETGRRFSLAHELCHVLYDRDRAKRITHTSTPWAPASVEQRANAFAAMLLMPPEAVHRAFKAPRGRADLQAIAEAAGAMKVSLRAAIQHLANLGEIAEEERDRLLEELADGRSAFTTRPAHGN